MLKKYVIKPLKNLVIIFAISFVLLEVVLAIYIRVAEIKIELPTYTFQNTQSFWFDLNDDFGTLHLPNDEYRQKKYCFDVVYSTNSQGFRDAERTIQDSENRVVALGDSFTEGIGVSMENRLTNLLESDTNIPHLNFGLAGNFGPIQYMMLYKTHAKNYTHNAVLVGILPSNDFIDDDYDIALKVGNDRYKPFLKGTYPSYDIVYHTGQRKDSKAQPKQQRFLYKLLKNFTYSYNMYRYLQVMQRVKAIPEDQLLENANIPSYFNFTEAQFDRMKFCLAEIKRLAGNRPVIVYSIPIEKEIKAYREHRKNPLGKQLKVFCDSMQIPYLDLLPKTDRFTEEEYQALFLSCDGHWSEAGNTFAKEELTSFFTYYATQ